MTPIMTSFEDVASALEKHTADKRFVTYNDFAAEVGLPPVNNLFKKSAMNLFFEQIDADDSNEQRPFRTAVVVQKATGRPGSGFYRSLESFRGITIPPSEEEAAWEKEISHLQHYYDPSRIKPRIEIELSFAQSKRLKSLAVRYGRTPEGLLERMLTDLLAHLERKISKHEEAMAQVERGETHSHEEVMEMLRKRLKQSEEN